MTAAVRRDWHPRDIYHWYPEWQPKANYIGRHRKAPVALLRHRTELPTGEIPALDPLPPYVGDVPAPKWRTWFALVGAVFAVLTAAVIGEAVSDFADDPIPTLVRDVPTLPAWTLPGVKR